MKLFTIGYGGRSREEFLSLLMKNDIRTVVDVRLRPDRASMGIWVKAKTDDKGIEKMLTGAGIGYKSLIELGNVFLEFPDWQVRYRQLLDVAGELLITRLIGLPEPFCLLCAENDPRSAIGKRSLHTWQKRGAMMCSIWNSALSPFDCGTL